MSTSSVSINNKNKSARSKVRKIKTSDYAFVCCLIMFLFKPDGLDSVSVLAPLGLVFTAGQLVCVVYSAYVYIRQPMSLLFKSVLLIGALFSLGTVVNGTPSDFLNSHFFTFLKIIAIIMLFESYINFGKVILVFKAASIACLIILLCNLFVTFVWNPGGLYSSFGNDVYASCFYGNKNSVRNPLFFGFLCSLFHDQLVGKRISFTTVLFACVGLVSMLVMNSSTSLVVFILMMALCALFVLRGASIRAKTTGVVTAALAIFFVFVRKFDFIKQFVTATLNKDMTFSNRTYIWDSALRDIFASPLIGYGFNYHVNYSNPNNAFLTVNHTHDAYLDVAARGGLFALLVLGYVCLSALIELDKSNTKGSKAVGIVLFAFLVSGIFGELWNPAFYAVLCIALQISKIEETESEVL